MTPTEVTPRCSQVTPSVSPQHHHVAGFASGEMDYSQFTDKRIGSALRVVAQNDTDQPPLRPPTADKIPRLESRTPVAAATSRTAVYFSLIPITPGYPTHAVGYDDEGRGERETGQCRPSVVRFWDIELAARTNELTRESIKEPLLMYLQPIKNDDPQLDFYTRYKRETVDHDTEYVQKYNEDLNTTLIFTRCSIKARARLPRTLRSLPLGNPPHPQPIHFSERGPRRPSGPVEGSQKKFSRTPGCLSI